MNIKNAETERLAHELAALTGESLTAAITNALRARLDGLQRGKGPSLAGRLIAIGQECASRLKEPFRSVEHGDLLYDDRGMPR